MRALTLLLVAAGCASGAASSRTVVFRSLNNRVRPVALSVANKHVVGSNLDASLVDGCVRGNWGHIPVNFCREDKGQSAEQHWVGSSGDFTVHPEDGQVAVTGWWNLDTGRTVSMTQTIRLGQGAGWDELKANPALLAVAATAANLEGTGLQH